jgi:hypothetical protein
MEGALLWNQNLPAWSQATLTPTLYYTIDNAWELGKHQQLGLFHAPHIVDPSLPTSSIQTEVERHTLTCLVGQLAIAPELIALRLIFLSCHLTSPAIIAVLLVVGGIWSSGDVTDTISERNSHPLLVYLYEYLIHLFNGSYLRSCQLGL